MSVNNSLQQSPSKPMESDKTVDDSKHKQAAEITQNKTTVLEKDKEIETIRFDSLKPTAFSSAKPKKSHKQRNNLFHFFILYF